MKLKLYKLIMGPDATEPSISYVEELGWINDKNFCVWVSYTWLKEFVDGLKSIFGNSLFDEGGFAVNMQEYCVCINLSDLLGDHLNLEDVFPKDEFPH